MRQGTYEYAKNKLNVAVMLFLRKVFLPLLPMRYAV